jgi:hypothetical protein
MSSLRPYSVPAGSARQPAAVWPLLDALQHSGRWGTTHRAEDL